MTPLDIMMLGRAGPRSSTDADALAWAAAVTAASGTYSAGTLAALSTLIAGLKADGLWSKMTFFNPVCGDQLAAARVQYKSTSGAWAQAAISNLVSGDYTESTGIKGNGTNKRLDTGVTIAQMPGGGNSHLGFYGASMETSGASDNTLLGAFGSSPFPGYEMDSYANTYGGRRFGSGNVGALQTTGLLASAYMIGSQTSLTTTVMYQGAVSVATTSSTATATQSDARTLWVLANNDPFSSGQYSVAACRGYHGGQGLTSGDVSAIKTRMDTFNTALSRAV